MNIKRIIANAGCLSSEVNSKIAECSKDCDVRGMICLSGCNNGLLYGFGGCNMGYAIWHHVLTPQLVICV